jgi:RHS repeat-associated protein
MSMAANVHFWLRVLLTVGVLLASPRAFGRAEPSGHEDDANQLALTSQPSGPPRPGAARREAGPWRAQREARARQAVTHRHSGGAAPQPLRWQSHWYIDSGSGLYDFRARVWSPELAAFLQPDEFGFLSHSGTLWSWPGQNPFRSRDPSGRQEYEGDEEEDPFGDGLPGERLAPIPESETNLPIEPDAPAVAELNRSLDDPGSSAEDPNDPNGQCRESDASKRYTPDQQAVIELAKEARRFGIDQQAADALIGLANETGLPARNDVGTDHWRGGDHIHIGPVNHIPVLP